MKKQHTLLVVILLCGLLVSACSGGAKKEAADLLEQVLERGTLVIATDPAYPPASQLVEDATRPEDTKCTAQQHTANEFTGFDIDTAVEVANRLGVEPCFVTPDWTLITGGSWANRWDISIGSMTITAGRMEKLYFTHPYYVGVEAIFVHEDNTTLHEVEDLSGMKIGGAAGTTYEFYVDKSLSVPGVELDFAIDDAEYVGYDSDLNALQDLAIGDGVRLDAVFTGYNIGQDSIKNDLPFRMLDETFAFAFNSGAVDKAFSVEPIPLVRRVSEIIKEMHADGTLVEYSMKHFGYDTVSGAADFNLEALDQW